MRHSMQHFVRHIAKQSGWIALATLIFGAQAFASEAELPIPELNTIYTVFGMSVSGETILGLGMVVGAIGLIFGLVEFLKIKALPAHDSMLEVSHLIYETCKTYLFQQGKLLLVLEAFIGSCMFYYFFALKNMELPRVLLILLWSVLGIAGSFGVAWFGIRINTYANSRTAFASLGGKPYSVMDIPLRAGMSIGVLLICVELIMMLFILLFIPKESAGACFIGFAIGESLGASALRICGGIFTKIADIGSDLMKIVFNIKEDDARNPGVIADCTGDNAGDSVGPTADGFETYGVTGVALISFIVLAVGMTQGADGKLILGPNGVDLQARLIVWIFAMRVLMIVTSIFSYWINGAISRAAYAAKDHFDFEAPLTSLVWITSLVSIAVTFMVSAVLIKEMGDGTLWWKLSLIISCGTIAAAVIPELTKVFTSAKSKHVAEIVSASREGGASLAILSGLVAGNFSAFWKGMTFVGLMLVAYLTSSQGLGTIMVYPAVFSFGLVAFGFLGMGPVTIAVDSYGPVTDNAQSVFELSQIESIPGISAEIEKKFGFKPNFEQGKHRLEENDSAGNTFKATAKPVLIGTAVIGATTMIFSIILLLNLKLDLLDPRVLLGLITGGAVVYWFTGASMQAVTTGAYRAVEFIKANIRLDDGAAKASVEDSKKVVQICTQYAQAGMVNIFGVIFCFTLAFACFDPTFFASYLISIAVFGLFQAIFMANAGGAWDNAKKVVEVDLREKGSALHAATVVGDTVGDPFKDTSSVALNPIIKFTTLFGLLAVEIAVSAPERALYFGIVFFIVGCGFVARSFYGMRISNLTVQESAAQARAKENKPVLA
ncbi:sodium-translocating pyrophosphatase [Bdellovibrionota bacterium FG-1]